MAAGVAGHRAVEQSDGRVPPRPIARPSFATWSCSEATPASISSRPRTFWSYPHDITSCISGRAYPRSIGTGMLEADATNQDASVAAERVRFRSVHTTNFPSLLERLGISLLVTTYQAGKLVTSVPTGIISIRTSDSSHPRWAWRLVGAGSSAPGGSSGSPTISRRPGPSSSRQAVTIACFLPRRSHVTGNVQIHEIAWAGNELGS